MSDIVDEEYIESLKDVAKRSGVPWQFIHGSAPQEMLNNPSAYHWDGTLKELTHHKTENPKMSEQKIDATVAFTFPDGIQGLALLQLVNADGTPLTESQIELTIKNIASAIQVVGAEIYGEMTGPGDQR